jgi:formylglycine-generating enzyme required for sulfatase activity
MKIGSCRGSLAWALVFCSLWPGPPARGQDPTLILTVASDSLTAGDSMSVWMTALNTSGSDISWTFPPEIKSAFVSPQSTLAGSLPLYSTEARSVVLAPGTFARREYVAAVPEGVTGQVVLEFPGLDVNRTVMDIEARTAATGEPAGTAAAAAANPSSTGPASPAHQVIADLNLELIWVQPGSFTNGSPDDEPFRGKAEGPRTHVTLTKGYWLGRTEVTQAQYESLMRTNPSTFKAAGSNAPVEGVSWNDAMEFCRALTGREKAAGRLPAGYEFTLPTEAQWEYACRAGATGSYAGEPEAMAWYDKNSDETTHPVAMKKPNRWGFYDMSGNVLEWCFDWYGPYPGGSVTDPVGPATGSYKIARGGSWRNSIEVGRSAARAGGSIGRQDYTIGFRLALAPVH